MDRLTHTPGEGDSPEGKVEMEYSNKYWDDRFGFVNVPEKVKSAIKRVYESYPMDCMPQGVCDPMYIMAVFLIKAL